MVESVLFDTNLLKLPTVIQEEKSLWKKIKETALKIFLEFARWFKSVDISYLDKEIQKDVNIQRASNFRPLNHSIVTEYSELMLEEQTIWAQNFDQIEIKDQNFVFIPVVLEGKFRKHIVSFLYDKKKETLYYFDSNGDGIRRNSNRQW